MTDFVTDDDLASFMDIDVDDLPASATLGLAAAQETVRRYLDQELTFVGDDEEIRDGKGNFKLRLKQRPVREISELSIDGDVIEEDGYILRGAIITLVDEIFTAGVGSVVITYDHGWDLESELDSDEDDSFLFPADIRLVTLSAARRFMQRWGAAGVDGEIMMETIGDYSYTLFNDKRPNDHDLLRYETAVLDRYAVRLVP